MARRCLILLAALILASVPPGIGASATTVAPNIAGILIDTGEGDRILVAVAFAEEEILAVELLERSGLSTLTVPFGGLGEGVCMIEATGCDIAACRRNLCQSSSNAPFWQFLSRQEGREWKTSPLGASSVTVANGGLTAWLWTTDAPETLPEAFSDVLAATGHPTLDAPARHPRAAEASQPNGQRDWVSGVSMLAVACIIAGGLVLRSRHAAR